MRTKQDDSVKNTPRQIKMVKKDPSRSSTGPGPSPRMDSTAEVLHWVIKGQLAYAQRPRTGPRIVHAETVDRWLQQVRRAGVKSFIVMLTEDEMDSFYPTLGMPLVQYYRAAGFHVRKVANEDQNGIVSLRLLRERVQAAFSALAKPVLVHCDAGEERALFAVRAILKILPKRIQSVTGGTVKHGIRQRPPVSPPS
jgi:hypothetical protein